MTDAKNQPNNTGVKDIKKQKKILNSKYLNKLKEEDEGLPELRVI